MLVRGGRDGGRPVHPFTATSAPLPIYRKKAIANFRKLRLVLQGIFFSERLGTALATAVTDRELIEAVVVEMQDGIERAVGFWMTQIEEALRDPGLTTLGRMNAVQEIVIRYAADRTGENHGYAA
jgi:hypothetical protein